MHSHHEGHHEGHEGHHEGFFGGGHHEEHRREEHHNNGFGGGLLGELDRDLIGMNLGGNHHHHNNGNFLAQEIRQERREEALLMAENNELAMLSANQQPAMMGSLYQPSIIVDTSYQQQAIRDAEYMQQQAAIAAAEAERQQQAYQAEQAQLAEQRARQEQAYREEQARQERAREQEAERRRQEEALQRQLAEQRLQEANEVQKQFLGVWNANNISANGGVDAAYIGLLTQHRAHVDAELLALIQNDFLAHTNGNWAALFNIYFQAQISTLDLLAFFEAWSATINLSSIALFVTNYEVFLMNRAQDEHLYMPEVVWQRLLKIDENGAKNVYTNLVARNICTSQLMSLQALWLNAYPLPHDFSEVLNHYLKLAHNNTQKTLQPHEEQVWMRLIQSDPANGSILFEHFLGRKTNAYKLLELAKCWLKSLTSVDDMLNACERIKNRVYQSELYSFKTDFEKVLDGCLLKHVAESKEVDSEDTVKRIKAQLESTKTHFYSIGKDKKHAPYTIYHELRHHLPEANEHLAEELGIATGEINADLTKADEPATFRFG